MAAREYVPVRLSGSGLAQAQKVADQEFEGNRSAAVRRLLELGLAAWAAGARTADQVGRKR